ncbi:MAG: hypothetical protein LBU05_01700 [Bifidobacteriaceae bacterium]|jgi:hypothetical protein|nr:hypothetical protein [Bifidobacteriaceae bacterium]
MVVRDLAIKPPDIVSYLGLVLQAEEPALVDSLAFFDQGIGDGLLAWALARDMISPGRFDAILQQRVGTRNVRRLRG